MAFLDTIKETFGFPEDESKQSIKFDDNEVKDSDEILVKKLNVRISEANKIRKPKMDKWRDSIRFFDGDHWAVAGIQIPTFKANIFINKLFAAIRSLVAYETDSKPDPVVEAVIDPSTPDPTKIINITKKIEARLDYLWDYRNIPATLTEIYYDRYLCDDGYGMYFWNAVDDDVDFEIIKPQEILRSPGATSVEDAEYIIVEKWRNRKYFEENYPDKIKDKDGKDRIKFVQAPDDTDYNDKFVEKAERENLAKVHYYFEDKFWIVKVGDVILEKPKNKFWEFRTEEEQIAELQKKGIDPLSVGFVPIKNHLKKPEKPIVHFKGYHLGGEFESRSLMKQAISLNISIDKRKCQIQDILDGTGTPQWVIDPSVPQTDVEKITSKPGLKIRVNPTLIRKEPAMAYPQGTIEDMLHTQRAFDDIMGMHELSMGASPTKRMTKTEALMMRESDIVPVKLLMRNSEVAMTKLLNGWIQLIKLFYDQPHYISTLGQSAGTERYGEFLTREEIPENLYIFVRIGSTMPVSKEAKRAQYERDFARGAIALQDYLLLMEYPNPQQLAQNVQAQQQAMVQAQMAQQQTQGQV